VRDFDAYQYAPGETLTPDLGRRCEVLDWRRLYGRESLQLPKGAGFSGCATRQKCTQPGRTHAGRHCVTSARCPPTRLIFCRDRQHAANVFQMPSG